ncbi:MAG TPA: Fur family transcriptional regulator [Opitutales bacterium]|nr:Fur family transcriptional regulator [Opitutales bacterium]
MSDHDHHHIDPKAALTAALEKLRGEGLRITKPRRAILKTLLKLEKPATIEEIHQQLEPGLCDLATVYRCLATFEKLALVRLCHFRDGTSLYEIDRGPDHQHHIVCTACNKVETLDFCVVEGLERLVRERGYRNVSHLLEFFGICGDCVGETGTA